jgi:hypothetical protein
MPEVVTQPTLYEEKGAPPLSQTSSTAARPDETELVEKFWGDWRKSKQHKYAIVNPVDQKRYAEIYYCQHWNGNQKPWQSTPTIPLSTAAVNSILPVITDNRPQIAIVPRNPEDERIADVLRAIVEWLWEENNCDVKLPATILNSLVFGNGFWKILWNPALRKGTGDIQIVDVDPTCMFFNPEAKDIDDATEIWHVEQIGLDRIAVLWPEKGAEVTAKVKDNDVVIYRPQVAQKGVGKGGSHAVTTTTGSDTWLYGGDTLQREAPQNSKTSATVGERWRFDRETKRWERTVVANDVLLEGPDITDFDMAPFVHFPDYKTHWSIWGTGEIALVENLQYEINKRRGMILDILRFCSSPVFIYDPGAGADLEDLQMEPGISIPAEGGPQAANWLVPHMDLTGLFGVNDRDKQDINDILGNVDIIQGKRPVGVEAGIALETLGDAANTRLRLKVRLMEAALRRCGKILIQFIQKHYTSMRIFRIVGSEFGADGSPVPAAQVMQNSFVINKPVGTETVTDDSGFPVIGEDGMPQQQNVYDQTSNMIPPDAEFDVRIGAGSTLPVSRTAKFQQAITLFDRGALPLRELLRAAGWDRWEEIAGEMEQQRMMMQQQAMMGAQQGPTPQDIAMMPDQINLGRQNAA